MRLLSPCPTTATAPAGAAVEPTGGPSPHSDVNAFIFRLCLDHQLDALLLILGAAATDRHQGGVSSRPWRRWLQEDVDLTCLLAFDVLNAVFRNYVHLRGGWEWEVPMDAVDFRRGSIRDNIGAALQWIATERIKADGLFLRANPRDCETVYKQLQARDGTHLTAVFDWSLLEKSA